MWTHNSYGKSFNFYICFNDSTTSPFVAYFVNYTSNHDDDGTRMSQICIFDNEKQ